METCPRCGNEVGNLQPIDAEMLEKLRAAGESPPQSVCGNCLSDFANTLNLTRGGILVAQEKAKEQHRQQIWKSRVSLIKRARSLMGRKLYSDAAVSYEKYLRILEIVFNCQKGERLTPEKFKESARTSELTVVTSVYWDLLRIYDSSDKYLERQQIAGRQLALFVQFTPIYPDVIRRAEVFVRSAKHPQVIKAFLRSSAQQRPRCFIATAAYGDPHCFEVQTLRWFRDHRLKQNSWGRLLILGYYKLSPPIARWVSQGSTRRTLVRLLLRPLLKVITR